MRALRPAVLLALAVIAALAGPARAQGFRDARGGTPGQFDFYVLALSWSPTFCLGKGAQKGSPQCDVDKAHAFVVHGLWPQYERGFPSYCGGANRTPTRAAMDKAAEVFPDAGLARYEWSKHGVCAGGSATDYFEEVAAARAKVTIPEQFRQSDRTFQTSALDVERAFVEANRGLRVDMMSVQCARNMLQEVRICMSRDLRTFVSCQEVDRSGCRARDISVPASR